MTNAQPACPPGANAFCQCDSLSKALLVVLEVVDATKPADALSMIAGMAAAHQRKEPRLPRG